MRRFALTVRLKPGSVGEVRGILRQGPPFDIESTALERHQVFLVQDELVFVFEGLHADAEVRRSLDDAAVFGGASRLAAHIEGPPRVLEEVFSWERPVELDGVSFSALPGAGDSDGG
jgi:hypothetical protein